MYYVTFSVNYDKYLHTTTIKTIEIHFKDIILKRGNIDMKSSFIKKILTFLNSLAYSSKETYSIIGPYEPKMPEKLKD